MSTFSSVRFRLALWNVGVLAVILAIFGYALRFKIASDLMSGVDVALSQSAGRAQESVAFTGNLPPYLMQRGLPQGLARSTVLPTTVGAAPTGPFAVSMINLSGVAVDRGHPIWDAKSIARSLRGQRVYSTVSFDHSNVRIYSVPIYRHNHILFVLQFARSLEQFNTEVWRITRGLLTLIPLALLIVGAGAVLLTERALRPVRDIAESTERIEAKDLSGRLKVSGRDEFSDLAVTINGMLGRLDKAFTLLSDASEKQRRFTADASHELRTPLTIIKANTSLALSSERTPEEYRKTLVAVDRAADRMAKIVQDLLYIARSDARELFIASEPVNLLTVVKQAVEAVANFAGLKVVIDIGPGAWISGDEEALVRLFANLLQNAYRYTPPHGSVTIRSSKENRNYLVRIIDTGTGIAPEHIQHLGERFFRVDDARGRACGGTGLGLAICRSIVESHGGSMTIESTVEVGTTVTVSLPMIESHDLPRAQEEPQLSRS